MPDFNHLISLRKIKEEDVRAAVFQALQDIHADRLFTEKNNARVLIKPNVLSGKPPERAVTTHPTIIRAVIQWVKQFKPSRIVVCDSSGGNKPGATEKAMKLSGILEVCESEGVECFPFEKSPRLKYTVENPLVFKEFFSSSLIAESDIIIDLPKVKTHELCTLTCSIKNMFGTVLLGNKAKVHTLFPDVDKFSAALVDIYSTVKPHLILIDGYYAMEGHGPAAGEVVKWDLILAGYDGLALDRLVCQLIGLDPKSIPYFEPAVKKGIGSLDLEKFTIVGESPESVARKFKPPRKLPIQLLKIVPSFINNYAAKVLYRANWHADPDKCILCGICWTNCPVNALSPPEKKEIGKQVPIWEKNKCITCFCCSELCPQEAIKFKVPIARNFLFSKLGLYSLSLLAVIAIIITLLTIF